MKYFRISVRVFLFLLAVQVLALLFYLLSPGSGQEYPSFAQAIFGTVGYYLLKILQYPLALLAGEYPFASDPALLRPALLGMLNAAVQTFLLVGAYYLFRPRFRDGVR